MSDNFYTIEKNDNGDSIVRLPNEVQGGNDALDFQSIITQFAASGHQSLKVDMSEVININSSGLGMLISALSHLKKAGKSMELINVPDKVKKLLQITQFDKLFNT